MLRNVQNIPNTIHSSTLGINSTSVKITQLIILLLSTVMAALPATAKPNPQIKKNRQDIFPKTQPKNQLPPSLPPLPANFRSQPVQLAPGKVRLMVRQLSGLIGRFETTLLTADAQASNLDLSTGEAIEQVLAQQTSSTKQSSKLSLKSDYQDAHLALKQARSSLRRFQRLVDQGEHVKARAEWTLAKQTLWENYPTDRPVAHSEVRGMWLDRGTIVKAKSEADLVKVFDRMAEARINTVFFETVNSGYTIYPSKIAPQQNPLVKGWDPLKTATKLAHERGIELHAWVWTFAAVNQRHNEILGLPRNYLGPVLAKHPDWAATDHEGSRFHYNSRKVFLDPANPEVQQYLSSLLREIAQEYDVDGIHLDYIRYPFQSPTGKLSYGYGKAAREQFYQQTGVDPMSLNPNHYLWSEWIEFRTEQIDNFVGMVSQDLKQLRPELTISTAVFPMPKQERLTKIQQHWEKWLSKEWIDMLVPMTYAKDADRLDELASPLLREFDRGKALLLPGIRLLNISEVAALDQMQLLRGMSTEGYALFAAENLNADFATVFGNTQGNVAGAKQLLPHREPFEVTLSRYQSLQQEWNFFLTSKRSTMDEVTLEEWGDKADKFAADLEKLIEEPSHRHFFSTQISLNSLRRQFPRWMAQNKEVSSYQQTVWQNRLDTLDRLLSYGEKRAIVK